MFRFDHEPNGKPREGRGDMTFEFEVAIYTANDRTKVDRATVFKPPFTTGERVNGERNGRATLWPECNQAPPGGCLTCAFLWNGRRDSNPRPSPWQKNVRMTVQPVHDLRLRAGVSTFCPPNTPQSGQFVEWSTYARLLSRVGRLRTLSATFTSVREATSRTQPARLSTVVVGSIRGGRRRR